MANSGPDTQNVTVLLKNLLRLNKVRHEQDLFQQFLILVLFLNRLHGPQLKNNPCFIVGLHAQPLNLSLFVKKLF